jgi:hypothetical protein
MTTVTLTAKTFDEIEERVGAEYRFTARLTPGYASQPANFVLACPYTSRQVIFVREENDEPENSRNDYDRNRHCA